MPITLVYDPEIDLWVNIKTKIMEMIDTEGNKPCELCWEAAKEDGIYAIPLKIPPSKFERCSCGRMIGLKPGA